MKTNAFTRRLTSLLLMVAALPISGGAMPVELEGLTMQSDVLGREVAYSVILPDGYTPEAAYPVLYMFHGIGGDNSTWLEYGNAAKVANRLCETGEVQPFIMVIPDGYLSYYNDAADGSLSYETFLVEELIPLIDSTYSTVTTPDGRGVIGFSMGGFGALSVGLRNRHLFNAAIALSPSIRTDEQYCAEGPQDEWEKQWGRTFDGIGKTGADRLTPYYKVRSPHHILADTEPSELADFHIFIETGDEEGTLCESNERLHRLMLEKGIPHHWAVIDGGHDFEVWNASLPRAMVFASNARGGNGNVKSATEACEEAPECQHIGDVTVYLPAHDSRTNRRWPVVYMQGYEPAMSDSVARLQAEMSARLEIAPMAVVYLPADAPIAESVKLIEEKVPGLRGSQRMRVLMVGKNAWVDETIAANNAENLFTAILLQDAEGSVDDATRLADAISQHRRYPRIYILADPEAPSYDFASELHIILRGLGKDHEFRSGLASADLREWLRRFDKRIHI